MNQHEREAEFEKFNLCVRENVEAQVKDPGRVNIDHIKKSLIWNTNQSIRSIQRQLAEGYSFDTELLSTLINTMFGFINSVVKTGDDKASDVRVEEVVRNA